MASWLAWPLARRVALPVIVWILRRVDAETVWNAVESRVNAISARQQAIAKARMSGGTFGAWIAEGRTRYVVFKDDEPIDIFPPIDGDLAEAMRHYDRARLRRPEDLRLAVTRKRLTESLGRLRDRLRRGEDPAVEGPLALPERGGGLGERAGRAVFERMLAGLEPLLAELTAATPGAEAPARPGVYLVSDRGAPAAVGQTRDLRERLADLDVAGEVRWIEVEDPLLRAVFEPFAGQVLGL